MTKVKRETRIIRDKFLEYYNQGLNDSEIGRILNCNNATVCFWRKDNNLPSNFTQGNIQKEILNLHYSGFTRKEIELKGYNKKYLDSLLVNKKSNKKYPIITKDIISRILGTMLGDASISKKGSFTFTHKIKNEQYALTKTNRIGLENKVYYRNMKLLGKDFPVLSVVFVVHPYFHSLRKILYPNNKKQFPINYCKKYFNWESMAYWFMDDGNNVRGAGQLAIHSMKNNAENIKILFKEKLNLNCNIQSNGKVIYFPKKDFIYFVENIKPFVTKDMLYKIVCSQ